MMELVYNERLTSGKDWATLLFVACFAIIAINRNVFENRFSEFIKLAVSDKYTKIYKDSGNMLSWFTISFFLIQVISFTFLLQFLLSYNNDDPEKKTSWIFFIQLFTLIGVFILAKYLIEKIIATAFNIEEFNELFNLHKVNYRTYIGLLLLPVNIFLFYNTTQHPIVIYVIIGLIIAASITSYLVSLRIYQNLILGKLFYFILYLCTLEIAPYYFMYYWFNER
jgi:MFS family permease